eukprot:3073412-Rhodomonas_salina.2
MTLRSTYGKADRSYCSNSQVGGACRVKLLFYTAYDFPHLVLLLQLMMTSTFYSGRNSNR